MELQEFPGSKRNTSSFKEANENPGSKKNSRSFQVAIYGSPGISRKQMEFQKFPGNKWNLKYCI